MRQPLPSDFVQAMQTQLGAEWEDFQASLSTPGISSIHYNLAKYKDQLFSGDIVPWNNSAQYLEKRPSFTLDPHFHSGRYYVQEAGSMFIVHLLKAIQKEFNVKTALDLCAAPGGKTTLLLNHLPDDCLLVSNEVIKSRFSILRENLAKWGRSNIIATQADSQAFAPMLGCFDLVLVDAPCSGEGLFRKTPDAIQEWSPENVQLCESRQRRILANALPLVRDGGYLIYSTCTYNERENDQNIAWMLAEGDYEVVPIEVPDDWNIRATQYGMQFYPHRTRSEGFFVSLLRKRSAEKGKKKGAKLRYYQKLHKKEQEKIQNWIKEVSSFQVLNAPKQSLFLYPAFGMELLEQLSQCIPRFVPGIPLGMIKGKDLVPAHELSLSIHLSDKVESWNLEKEEALNFLRKKDLQVNSNQKKGWNLMSYEGYGLGWAKVLPRRVNNYFPNHLRIRK